MKVTAVILNSEGEPKPYSHEISLKRCSLRRNFGRCVYRQARYSIEAEVNILAPECTVPIPTTLVNLKAMLEAAREGHPLKRVE